MPYSITPIKTKLGKVRCYEVKNIQSGKIHSKCSSKKKAEAQLRLLQSLESQEGAGWFGDLIKRITPTKRKEGVLPPQSRDLLAKIGNEPITSLTIVRTPLDAFVKTLLNVVSVGQFSSAVKKSSYDEMWHLTLQINGKYTFEKLEVVRLQQTNPIKAKSETLSIPAPSNTTIQQMVDKTREAMGDQKFSDYDPWNNNCQDFLLATLKAINALTPQAEQFIKQDAQKVLQKLPPWTAKISKFITDIGAVSSKIIEGEGKKQKGRGQKISKAKSLEQEKLRLEQFVDRKLSELDDINFPIITEAMRKARKPIARLAITLKSQISRALSLEELAEIEAWRLLEFSTGIDRLKTKFLNVKFPVEKGEDEENPVEEEKGIPPEAGESGRGGSLKRNIQQGLKTLRKVIKKVPPQDIDQYMGAIRWFEDIGTRWANNPENVEESQVLDWLGDIDLAFGDVIDSLTDSVSSSSDESKSSKSSNGGKINKQIKMKQDTMHGGFLPLLLGALAPTLLGKLFGNGIHGGSLSADELKQLGLGQFFSRQPQPQPQPRLPRRKSLIGQLKEIGGLPEDVASLIQEYALPSGSELQSEIRRERVRRRLFPDAPAGTGMQSGGFLPLLLGALAPSLLSGLFGGGMNYGGMMPSKTDQEIVRRLRIKKILMKILPEETVDQILSFIQSFTSEEEIRSILTQVLGAQNVASIIEEMRRPITQEQRREQRRQSLIPTPPRRTRPPSSAEQSEEEKDYPPPSPPSTPPPKKSKGEGMASRKPNSWTSALKEWNAKKGGKYCIPKKGSKEYEQVRKLMK